MNLAPPTLQPHHHRILIIDDNPSIHEDFRKILVPADAKLAEELDVTEASLFGDKAGTSSARNFQIDSAFQGEEGLEKVRAACAGGAPYAVAFVDVRMPPGWDGIETISRIWKEFPDLQIVICTAYSDYSWDEIAKSVGNTDQMLVLKKPFDSVEVLQMAHALSKKWQLTQVAQNFGPMNPPRLLSAKNSRLVTLCATWPRPFVPPLTKDAKFWSLPRISNSEMLLITCLSCRTSLIACGSKTNCARPKRWKRLAASRPGSPTTSTTFSPSFLETRQCNCVIRGSIKN